MFFTSLLLRRTAGPAVVIPTLSSLLLASIVTAAPRLQNPPVSSPKPSGQQSSATFDELARRAAELRAANSLEESISLYRQALRMRPSWTEGWWYLGTMLYELDRCEEAIEAFRRVVSVETKAGPAWALLGLCEFQLREYTRALENIERGRSLGLGDNQQLVFVSRYHAALLMTRFERFEPAFALLFALAREHYDNPSIVEALGLNLLRLPFLPKELPPDRREMVLMAGRAAANTAGRRLEEARREYEQLVERYPRAPNVHYAYGVFLLQGEPDAALEQFRRELEISPSHVPARLQMTFEYVKRADYISARPYAEQAVSLDPRSFAARNALGRVLLEMGEIEKAIQELEMGVQFAPDSPETRFALAKAYARAGRKEEAERERQEFLRLDKIRRARGEIASSPLPPPQP